MKTLKNLPDVKTIKVDELGFSGGGMKDYTLVRKQDLTEFSFANINLERYIFVECDFSNVSFNGTELTKVKFISCQMKFVCFDNATLVDVRLETSYLGNSTFEETKLKNVYGFMPDFTNVDFRRATVEGIFFWMGTFKGVQSHPHQGFRTSKGGGGASKVIAFCDSSHENCITCNIVGCNITGITKAEIDSMPRFIEETGVDLIAAIYARIHPDEEIKIEIWT